jgi:hypothetical protein
MSGDPWPCPNCGIGDADRPLIELKEDPVVVTNGSVRLKCGGCGEIRDFDEWLDNEERRPACGSHDCEVVKE